METETDKHLSFLHEFISNVGNNLTTSVIHESTYTGLLLGFTSFNSCVCQIGLIKYLVDRVYKILFTFENNLVSFHFVLFHFIVDKFFKSLLILLFSSHQTCL